MSAGRDAQRRHDGLGAGRAPMSAEWVAVGPGACRASKAGSTWPGAARVGAAWVAASTAALTLLAGCTTVGPDFKRPDAPKADRYTQQHLEVESGATPLEDQQLELGEPAADREWWHLFRSESLDAVVKQAV